MESLRILHWNIHSWRDESGAGNIDAVAGLITRVLPDVVSLVEVEERWGDSGTLNELANRCHYTSIFVPAFEYGEQDGPAGGFGNALLVQAPVMAVRQWQLLWPTRVFDGSEPSEPRSVLLATCRIGDLDITIGSVHLPRAEADTRREAFQRLRTALTHLGTPFVVCGDYNMPASDLPDAQGFIQVYPERPQPSYPASRPLEAIDYCIASSGITADAHVLDSPGSDHLPVLFTIKKS